MRIKLTRAAIALLFVAATPILAQQSTQATEIAGPATCYLSDENDTILEPRQEYQPAPGAATLPSTPSPVVQGNYTLQTSAPAVNFDPDNPALHFVCEVQYSALGHLRLVDPSGQVLASASMPMTQRIPLAQHRPLSPSFPTATRSFPAKQFLASTRPRGPWIRTIPLMRAQLAAIPTS